MKIQLITKRFYENVEDLIDSFDINACRIALYQNNIYINKVTINDIKKKLVTLNTITHPNSTFRRIMKYSKKGYKVPKETVEMFVEFVYNEGLNANAINKEFYID